MASTRRKAAAVALAVVGIAGLSLAAAAQLDVTSSSLSAATTVVASCQADDSNATTGIKVTFGTTFVAPEYNVTTVGLSGVAAGCVGQPVQLTLKDTAGNAIGTASGTAALGNATVLTISGSTAIEADKVEGAAIVIGG